MATTHTLNTGSEATTSTATADDDGAVDSGSRGTERVIADASWEAEAAVTKAEAGVENETDGNGLEDTVPLLPLPPPPPIATSVAAGNHQHRLE